jgi:amino acid adenylation domain-containing protein
MLIKKFEEQVKKAPHQIAVKTENQAFTYGQLNRCANRIGRLIERAWPKHRETANVGLLLEHGCHMIAAILGTLKAGKTYVPLSPDYPHNRIAYMLEHSESSLVIADSGTGEKAKKLTRENNIPLIDLDACHEAVSSTGEDMNPTREINGKRLAYILYTSGSTGKPKGVMQNHQNVLYFIRNWTRRFSITNADRITLLASFCHDGSIPDIYGALLNGAALYPYDVRNRDSNLKISDFLTREKITIWHSVPSLYTFFVNNLTGEEHFHHLRYIMLGGEPLRGYEIEMFKKHFPETILVNIYGQTESTLNSMWMVRSTDSVSHLLIGDPLDHTRVFVVDEKGDEVDRFQTGEILVACPHISPGYWKNPVLTQKSFSLDPEYGPMYWTGDLGRLLPGGNIEFMGRKDLQVKIRGFRVEPGEIETTLLKMGGIKEAAAAAKESETGNTYLCAFIVAEKELKVSELRNFLAAELPDYMIPLYFVQMEKMPMTPTGKIDRTALAAMEIQPLKPGTIHVDPETNMEKTIASTWKEVLDLEKVGTHDNLFEIGGNSFDIIKINGKLSKLLQRDIPIVKLFEYPTIETLANYLNQHQKDKHPSRDKPGTGSDRKTRGGREEIAVIGMAGRFPGANNIDEFWENLKKGVESISFFSRDEMIEAGISSELAGDPNYVKAKGTLENIEFFDAAFFNFNPNEATVMDPQLRTFYECAWEALEHAGYSPPDYDGLIGVYSGNASNIDWLALVFSQSVGGIGEFEKKLLNSHSSTYISYKLDLKGPSVTLQTACSTSLVAVHMACQGLLLNECHMALANGVSIAIPKKSGYLYQEGMIFSPDGHVRAFDANSKGTVFGDGAGSVVLKKLKDALADGDFIYAVIKGSAINNDGMGKVGYTAPGINGQREVVRFAQIEAGVEPESISFIETHGTGTIMGDAVEIEALNQLFPGNNKKYCSIASVKSNVGHLNTAAGIVGFIKTVLCLKNKLIPPSINFEIPNPEIDFENSPFYVNTKLCEWKNDNYPLRAGVSSFGLGGTNAHVVLEEWAPAGESAGQARPHHLILLSARTETALDRMTQNLVNHFQKEPGINLADSAYTLQVGRRAFQHRRMLVCSEVRQAVDILSVPDSPQMKIPFPEEEKKIPVIYMFPGQGAQYVNMGLDLYRTEPLFREAMDRCFEILKSLMGHDIKDILYPGGEGKKQSAEPKANQPHGLCAGGSEIDQTRITQPVLLAIEYALAQLLKKFGITPYAMIGHSIGEYTAACLSGVFTLKDALTLAVLRGKLMQELPGGRMVGVPLSEQEVRPFLNDRLSLAAVNSTCQCVVSGPPGAVEEFVRQVKGKGHRVRRLHTSRAFHSAMMEPLLEEFEKSLGQVVLKKPQIPFISNLTGGWISGEEVTKPGYWTTHIRGTVRFAQGLEELLKEPRTIFLEVGPGRSLTAFVKQHEKKKNQHLTINLIKHPKEKIADTHYLLSGIGQLWLFGKGIDRTGFYDGEKRRRIPLPTYPFEKKYHWIQGNLLKVGDIQSWAASSPGKQAESTGDLKKSPHRFPVSNEPAQMEKPEISPITMLQRPQLRTEYIAPANHTEQVLAHIWSKFFGFQQVGTHDDFFELGGDSLKATVMVSKIHKELNVEVPISEFFNRPTPEALAQYIRHQNEKNVTLPLQPAEEKNYYPLSSAQKRLYILQEMNPNNVNYNESKVITLEGKPEKSRLEDTFKKMIARHESLRTSFEIIDGEPVQKIHLYEEVDFEIQYYELSISKDTGGQGSEAEKIIRSFTKPFDLSKAPLLRVGLIRIPPIRHPRPGTAGSQKGMGIPGNKHILILDIHHIITDGISQNILINNFLSLYNGRQLPSLKLQYKDYAQWQQNRTIKETLKKQEDYWVNEFQGEIPLLHLSTDFSRPAVQSFEGNTLDFEINANQTRALNEIAKTQGATLFMALLAIFDIFLSKVSSQEDVTVGIPIAGRKHIDLQQVMGMFVNSLAVRSFPSGEKRFIEFLNQVKERTLEAFENQDYPFEELVEKVTVERDISRNPLFDVMFVLQNFFQASGKESERRMEGLQITPYASKNIMQTSKFDLTLYAYEEEEKLVFRLEYCTRLFREKTIEKLITYFKKIISSIIENPGAKISGIDILSEEEKNKILYDFNNTGTKYPKNKTIHQLFEEQAVRRPDGTALSGGRQSAAAGEAAPPDHKEEKKPEIVQLTYRQLNEKANRLVYWLKEKGVLADGIVAVMVERSIEMIIGIMAILKAGGAYLPIEPDYPRERIDYMLKDSSAKILLTGQDISSIYSPQASKIRPQDTSISPSSSLAYVIYTSGTTGKPKGTLTTHSNVIRVVKNTNYIDITAHDRLLQLSNYAFDGSVFDIYGALTNGAVLLMLKAEEVIDVDRLSDIIKKHTVTCFFVTTALFNTIVDLAAACLKGVRKVLFGGETVSVAHVRKALGYLGKNKIIHVYGPTETTVYASYYDIDRVEDKAGTIPIGAPLSNTSIYILDKAFKPVPIMVTGEVYIGGDGVARGYLNQPGLTAEKFLPAPSFHMSYIYRTGDLARWLPEGNIEFLGRKDHQVKIRGFRIESGEIETQLLKHKGINEAVVIHRDDFAGSKYLCAYIVPGSAGTSNENQLREFLSISLPHYMIPSCFVFLERIPLTTSGKIDRKALPEPEMTTAAEYMPPRNEIEKKLVEVWSRVLGREVGINDSFFQVGGDSIKAILLAARLKKHGLNLKINDLFLHPVIKELAKFVKKIQPQIDRNTDVGCRDISPEKLEQLTGYIRDNIPGNPAIQAIYPLTPMQKTMLYHSLSGKHKEVFFIQYLFRWQGAIESSHLETSLNQLIERHDIFRTIFIYENLEEPLQIVLKHRKVEFNYEDITHLPEEKKPLHLEKSRERDIKRGFDLGKDILVRATLFRVNVNSYHLMWSNHYILTDGWCFKIVFSELYQIYEGLKKGNPIELEEASPYRNYIRWLENQDKSMGFRYWRNYLAGYKHQGDLVPTKPGKPPDNGEYNFKEYSFVIDEEEIGALNRLATSCGVTVNMVFQTLWGILMQKYNNCDDIVFGAVVSGRPPEIEGIESMVGLFINTVPVRVTSRRDDKFSQLLKNMQKNSIAAKSYEYLPFTEILSKCQLKGNIIDSLMTFQNFMLIEPSKNGDNPAENVAPPFKVESSLLFHQSNYNFNIIIIPLNPFRVKFMYNASACEEDLAKRIEGHLKEILRQVTKNKDIELKHIRVTYDYMAAEVPISYQEEEWNI